MNIPIGQWLTERGVLQQSQLDRALRLQQDNHEKLGFLLVKLNMIGERDLADALAAQLDLPVVPGEDYPDAAVLPATVAPQFLRRTLAVPVRDEPEGILVAMADPMDSYTAEALRLAFERRIIVRVGVISDIEGAIERLYGDGVPQAADLDETLSGEGEPDADDVQYLRELASEEPVIRRVNALLSKALEARASDIHVEPFEHRLKVRYRIDGVLQEVDAPPVRSAAAVVSRIKVMANLNIAERRLPQDGRIKLPVDGREVDLRISTVPTLHGESVVMRILDRDAIPLDFTALGFAGDNLSRLRQLLARPQGVVLVTGPTGSGKTTTLYAALHSLNSPERKILTVEDPVEYQLEGINQIQVRPGIGLNFADALRSILRQDPDVIMVGEMRDLETATIAVQAALTGHKVFSTLHTNDATSTITRLLDMGIEDYLVTSTVSGVVAQRLIRTLCHACREPYEADEAEASILRQSATTNHQPDSQSDDGRMLLYRATGCSRCEQTGYWGRTCILELLTLSDRIRKAILDRADASALRSIATEEGAISMYADGLQKVLQGQTTLAEVQRATSEA